MRDCDFARVFDGFSKGRCSLACSDALFLACVVFSKSKKSCVFDGFVSEIVEKSCVFEGFVNEIVEKSCVFEGFVNEIVEKSCVFRFCD